jgi:hypothetical protein
VTHLTTDRDTPVYCDTMVQHRWSKARQPYHEELYTIITQIEACLNSHRTTPMSSDPTDLSALSPGHFLISDVLTSLPDPDLKSIQENRISHRQHMQQLLQHFWMRQSKEYLSERQHFKRRTHGYNITVDSLGLLWEGNVPPSCWSGYRTCIMR